MGPTDGAVALTFDLFGTILDLGGSLRPAITELLERDAPDRSPEAFWDQWRTRQRLEQYQDTIMMVGHAGYLETVRRALHYVLRLNELEPTEQRIQELMAAWQGLSPFPEVVPALNDCTTVIAWLFSPTETPITSIILWRTEFISHLTM